MESNSTTVLKLPSLQLPKISSGTSIQAQNQILKLHNDNLPSSSSQISNTTGSTSLLSKAQSRGLLPTTSNSRINITAVRKSKKCLTRGVTFDTIEEHGESERDAPKSAIRRESLGRRKSLVGASKDRRSSRGSAVDPRGILSHMMDPLAAPDSNCGSRKSMLNHAHDDLAHANEMKCKRGGTITTFEFVKTNLLSPVDIVEPDVVGEGLNAAIMTANTMPRSSIFFHRPSVCNEMNSDGKFRRDTMILEREQHQNQKASRFGILTGVKKKTERRSIAVARRTSALFGADHETGEGVEEAEERISFKSLVQAIIRAKRWNVPLYMGHADADEDKEHATSPMDFDVNKFKCDCQQTCPPKAKYAMTLDPWERTEQDVDLIMRVVKRLKCFHKYSHAVKRELARVIMFEAYGNGRIILQQGHPGFSMYFILSGSCSVQVNAHDHKTGEKFHQIVGEIQAGSCFGELALVKDITRTATVVCKGDSQFLRLDKSDFDNVLRRSMEIEWNSRHDQLKSIPYFNEWPIKEIREINIHAKIKHFKHDTLVLGDHEADTMPEHVYFVVKGRCNIVRRIAMLECSRMVGKHSSSQRVLKYRRIPGVRVQDLLGPGTINGAEALEKLNNLLKAETAKNKQKIGGMINGGIGSMLCGERKTVHGGIHDYEEPPASKLKVIHPKIKRSSVNKQLMRQKMRNTHHAVKNPNCKLYHAHHKQTRHGFDVDIGKASHGEGDGDQINRTGRKVVFKYLTVGRLEPGDSFGFGEDLKNVFIVTTSPVDFLTIPGHIMMRAERHIETLTRESQGANMQQLTKEMQREVHRLEHEEKRKAQTHSERALTKTQSNHHYEELRLQIEDKIPSERESFDRWRQSEDWKAYRASVLLDVLCQKGKGNRFK